jgi:hypothetical protein
MTSGLGQAIAAVTTEANTVMVLAQELLVSAGVREILDSLVATAAAVAGNAKRRVVVSTFLEAMHLVALPRRAIPLLVVQLRHQLL